jgi:hypothetical protein
MSSADYALTYVFSDGTRSPSALWVWSTSDLARGWKQLAHCLRAGFHLELRDHDTGQLYRLRAPRRSPTPSRPASDPDAINPKGGESAPGSVCSSTEPGADIQGAA